MIEETAFQKLCIRFFQDAPLIFPSVDDIILSALRSMTPTMRTELVADLDSILNGGQSDEELNDIWNASPSELLFPEPGDLRRVLTTARDMALQFDVKPE